MSFIFLLHSLWRWVVLVLALAAVGKALVGWLGKQEWEAIDDKLGLFYTVSFDIQLLLGLIIYVAYFVGFHNLRWYGSSVMRLSMEHVLMMVIALAIAHIARSKAKKAETALMKHRTIVIGFAISLILVFVSIPTWSTTAWAG